MNKSELMSMTVLQLRKLARDNHIVLGAGVDKTTIIEKIAEGIGLPPQEEQLSLSDLAVPSADPAPEKAEKAEQPVGLPQEDASSEAPAEAPAEVPAEVPAEAAPEKVGAPAPVLKRAPAPAPAAEPHAPAEPKYQAAWHSPDSPNAAGRASHPVGTFGGARPSWQNPAPAPRPFGAEGRPQPLHAPTQQAHRFGPAPVQRHEPEAQPAPAAEPPVRPAVSPLPDRRVGFAGNGAFGPAITYTPPAHLETPAQPAPAPESFQLPVQQEPGSVSPTLEELLASGDFEEGSGVLELHPDGYGFLRASNFLPSSKDIYVSMAQIRRFALRTGDLIQGKIRPQREGDKYAALLYIDTINGVPEAEAFSRPVFDELTPVYPSRRISLEFRKGDSLPDMRLIDLIAPLGFGQRGLILCPPETGKRDLLANYARVVSANFPDVTVLMLMIDMTPEDVTLYRDSVPCQVLASTFDQSPEAHLRLAEMVMERAMRLVEQQKDVILLVDSLTRLAKIYTTAAVQQGRSLPGMVNPASLLRAKKLFGAARACKEGGSLTVIAAMDVATGSRVDDSVVEEFKGTANMELMLDQSVAQAGISPAINLQRSYTKNADLLLNPRQKEGLSLIREMLGSTSSAVAIPQLLSMMEKTATNSELLLKMKDWFALMNR